MDSSRYWLSRGILFLLAGGYIIAWAALTLSPLVIPYKPPDLVYTAAAIVLMGAISLVAIVVADVASEVSGSDH